MKNSLLLIAVSGFAVSAAPGITIVVDYSLDSNNFFSSQARRDALQAATDRFSRIIDSELAAVGPGGTAGTPAGWRIGFEHPGTGASYEISTAGSFGSDPIGGAGAADQYGFGGLNASEWILFAGGRALGGAAGVGGTGTGTNFTSTFNDTLGPMHRGIADNTPGDTASDLPRWGGAISFDTGINWHFDVGTAPGGSLIDFYSVALHEVGHALGLSTPWNQWQDDGSGVYLGPEALAAFNADNGGSVTQLNLAGGGDDHWEDGAYDSEIFQWGDPNLAGTVGLGVPQDLLMEPVANFGGSQLRFELTNTDVGALRDLGWSVIVPEPSVVVFGAAGLLFFLRRRR